MSTLKQLETIKRELQNLKPRSQRRAVVQSRLVGIMTALLKQEVRRTRRKPK